MGEQVVNKELEPTQEETKKVEQKVEEEHQAEAQPPPFVLYIDLHCVGCAKKIEKILRKMRGIEEVAMDMVQNQVTLKGLMEPQAICKEIMKKTKRIAKVLSPLPAASLDDPLPQVVSTQATEPVSVQLDVNMHCEACAEQLKKKILKMKGVQNVETELKSSKVIVTGTMEPESLVEYVYRRTKKQAKIVTQPEPEPAPAVEEKKDEKAKDEKAKDEEKQKSDEPAEGKTSEEKTDPSKEEGAEDCYDIMRLEEEYMKKMRYLYPPQQPLYVVQRLPPAPQMFSDENPNACSIC